MMTGNFILLCVFAGGALLVLVYRQKKRAQRRSLYAWGQPENNEPEKEPTPKNRLKVIWGNFTEGAMSQKFIVRLICAYTLWWLNFWVFAPRFVPDIVAKWWANEWAIISTFLVGVGIFMSATHEVRIKPDDPNDLRTVPRDYVMWYVLVPLTVLFVLLHFAEVFK
jgi:hypothetical protein